MNSEKVDIVNSDDCVIGVTTRELAHRERLLHRLAAVFVFDDQDRLVVQVRKDGGLLDHSVGGHVGSGESYTRAATREAQEELGVTQPLGFVGVVPAWEPSGLGHLVGLFWCRVGEGWRFVANDEVDAVQHWEIDELRIAMRRNPEKFAAGFLATLALWLGELTGLAQVGTGE